MILTELAILVILLLKPVQNIVNDWPSSKSQKDYADLIFSNSEIGSTCELLYEIFVLIGFESKLNKDISSCLYLGMMTDTGSFQYSSVSSRTHEIISSLFNKKLIITLYTIKFTMILLLVDLKF